MDKKTGELVSADEAANMLQGYLSKHGIDPLNPPSDLFWATYFGIDRLKAMIAEIDKYNGGSKPNGEIMGVRVYRCVSQHQSKPVESALVMPVTDDEKDLYPIQTEKTIQQFTPNIVLEKGKPCPPWCGD